MEHVESVGKFRTTVEAPHWVFLKIRKMNYTLPGALARGTTLLEEHNEGLWIRTTEAVTRGEYEEALSKMRIWRERAIAAGWTTDYPTETKKEA